MHNSLSNAPTRWAPALVLFALFAVTAPAFAQAPPEPPKIWTVAASAGLAITSGNSDTSTINAAYDIVWDPQRRNIFKSDALFLRGKTDDELTANRLMLNVRDEFKLTSLVYVFALNQFLKDQFKDIDYLVAPTIGIGFNLIDTPETKFNVDTSVGGVWEKNPGLEVNASGALAFGERFQQRITANTTLTQAFTALWRMNNFDDSLYTLSLGLAASMSTRTQLKVEFQDIYNSLPPLPTIQRNDIAVLMAIVYKI